MSGEVDQEDEEPLPEIPTELAPFSGLSLSAQMMVETQVTEFPAKATFTVEIKVPNQDVADLLAKEADRYAGMFLQVLAEAVNRVRLGEGPPEGLYI